MRRDLRFQGVPNIGFELGTQLVTVGIDSLERLVDVGAREAWLRLRVQHPGCNALRTLLALHGAIEDRPMDALAPHDVAELRAWRRNHLEGEGAGLSDR
ncbi:MAG: TfoX/Sxy family DNA transformation protein [Armatimonadetes bacterium]|nr:TfoX/Sxy family DNA transformation protein [Armatimonadota bacterium]